MKLDINLVWQFPRDILEQVSRMYQMLENLTRQGRQIMSVISEYVAKQQSFNDRMETAVQGIGGDVKTLNDKITELQNSSGQITPADQALLDQVQAQGEALAAKFETLDALTPPAAPSGDVGGEPIP